MSLYRRSKGGNWWIDVTLPNGKRVRQSANTDDKQKAKQLEHSLISEGWNIVKLGEKPKRTWLNAVERWLKEKGHKKSIEDDKSRLRWLKPYLIDKHLHEIDRSLVDYITECKLEEDVSNTTVNRVLEILRAILNMAKNEWEWIDTVPKIRMLPKVEGRVRYLTHEESELLLNTLPEHLKAMAMFSLATGLRQGNVKRLKWTDVDLEKRVARVSASDSKTGKAIGVPLNKDAVVVLREQFGKHTEFVFTYNGNPITQVNTQAWRKALKRASIEDFRWHDLRHTWASWHVQNGTPLQALKELGGWTSMDMVMRYAHLSPDHLSQYADRLSELRIVNGTSASQRLESI